MRIVSPSIFFSAVAAVSTLGTDSEQKAVSLLEVVYGADIVTVGDAWDYVEVERSVIAFLLQKERLLKWPQRHAVLLADQTLGDYHHEPPQTTGFHKLSLRARLDGRVRALAFGIRDAAQS